MLKLCMISLLCLFSGVQLLATYGFFSIPKRDSKIVIDGKIDEKEWEQAVRLTNFQHTAKTGFAQEQTTVYITHDGKNFYAAMKMNASVLLHASNMGERFLAKVKENDKRKIWNDDCIEIRLRPPFVQKKSKVDQFYFVANANGACDSTGVAPVADDWYKKGQVKASKNDGFWCVEVCFPFSAFGIKDLSAKELENWTINFVRLEKNRGETSSLAGVFGKGHMMHSIPYYPKISFVDDIQIPAVRMPDISNGDISNIRVEYHSLQRLVGTTWTHSNAPETPRKRYETSAFLAFPPKCVPIKVMPQYKGKGNYIWKYAFTYGRKATRIFTSPYYYANADAAPIVFKFKNPADITRFTVNNIAKDLKKDIQHYAAPGNNEVNIFSKKNSITVKNHSEGGISLPLLQWKYFDGKKYQTADVKQNADGVTVTAPQGLKEYKFVTNFISGVSSMEWSGETDHLAINADGSLYFFWQPALAGLDMKEYGKNSSFNLIVPQWVNVVGASSMQIDNNTPYRRNKEKIENLYTLKRGENVKYNGEEYKTFVITAPKLAAPIKDFDGYAGRVNYRSRCLILLEADADANGKKGKVGYYTSVNGVPETPIFRNIAGYPALDGIQSKSRLTFYMTQFQNINNKDMFVKQLKTFRNAGCNEVYVNNIYSDNGGTNIGFTNFFHLRNGLSPTEINMNPIFAKYPHARGWASYANLSAIIRDKGVQEMLDKQFAELKKTIPHYTNLNLDYEFKPFMHYSSDSAYTLKIFADEYKITEKPLTRQIIEKKYLDKWIDFRCKELARATPIIRKLANKYGFEYTMYGTPDVKWAKQYCFNWPMIAEKGGLDRVYFGGVWNEKISDDFWKHANASKTPVMTSVHVCKTDNTGWKRGIIMRRMLLSRGGGILLWYEKGFDAPMLLEIAAVSKIAAKYNDFFSKGKYQAFVPGKGKIVYSAKNTTPAAVQNKLLKAVDAKGTFMTVIELNGKFMAVVLNYSDKPSKVTVRFDKAKGTVTNIENGKTYKNTDEISLNIAPYSYAAFAGSIK